MSDETLFSIIESFIAGFGKRESSIDIYNALFIAKELQVLSLPIEFKGLGRLGVESPKLYRILRDAKPKQENQEAYNIGEMFSEYNSRQLMLMASYLWNEGKNALDETERAEAKALLHEKFNIYQEYFFQLKCDVCFINAILCEKHTIKDFLESIK